MQGKEQKQPRERGEEQNEQRWNEERDRPPHQDDKLVSEQEQPAETGGPPDEEKVDKDGEEQVEFTAAGTEELPDGKDDGGDAVEWERDQEQAILDQWNLPSPEAPASEESSDQAGDEKQDPQAEKEEADSIPEPGEANEEGDMKQKPAGELIWKKGSDGDEKDSRLEEPADPLPADPLPQEKEEEKNSHPLEEEIDVPTYVPYPSDSPLPVPDTEKTEEADSAKRQIPTVWKVLSFLFLGLPLLAVIALVGGLLIGYSVVGDDPVGDIFSRDLWQHLYNMIYG
ncbi:DNA-directed RNA polymerase subunit beta [Desmospora profundinema]|uniref:DNA-directed RNA polymerase subunit beta n=1 Tax=Desmospora profundinema TaxID=1571184 RepID=A0ABU1INJ2_9BACL|nr:DNA-directed RNA polymerase subunit beta [Desmospora profundinema]MDR6225539.1 hypothetical protein [Desmospora profundinema]